MIKAAVAAAVMWLFFGLTPLEVFARQSSDGVKPQVASPANIFTISDAPEATSYFIEFFGHFNQALLKWWQGGGRTEIRGQWKIFASEHVRTGPPSIRSDLDVIAVSQDEDEMIQVIKTALQKAVAEYLSDQPGPRPNQLIATLAVISAKGLNVKSHIIILRPEASLKLIGNAAAAAIIRLLVENSKSPPAFAPTDQNGR